MSAPAIDDGVAAASTAATEPKLSATQLKKLRKATLPYTPPVDASGQRLYARKTKAPPQKQRRDLIAESNPNRRNLRRWGHTCTTVPPNESSGERVVAFGGWGSDFVGSRSAAVTRAREP